MLCQANFEFSRNRIFKIILINHFIFMYLLTKIHHSSLLTQRENKYLCETRKSDENH